MKRLLIVIPLLAGLLFLVWFSQRLAGNRIYQVDECQNIYVAHLLGTGQANTSFTAITLFIMPLMWLTRHAVNSVDMFVNARFFALELFWLNIVLLTLATGEKLFSRRGLIALAGAATLAPLWDYGFEIRHDNLFLSGMLLMWCVLRVRPEGVQSYFIAGALAVLLEFVAFKAFVYVIPISFVFLLFPPPGHKATRAKLLAAWVMGAVVAFLLVRIGYGMTGVWDIYLQGFRNISKAASSGGRFPPWDTLGRLLYQTPLLLALAVSGLLAMAAELWRHRRSAITWDSSLPEAFLLLVALGALIINPVPHPYNLLHIVPYAYLLAWRYGDTLLKIIGDRPMLFPAAAGILIFAHLVPFSSATRRHSDYTNYHQEGLMSMAENMTDADKDPVYDGIGMVPTRHSIHYQWFLHSLNIQSFRNGQEMPVRGMLAANPAAVIIPNYRTDWLSDEDHAYIQKKYVPLEDDFWVLGQILQAGSGAFEIIHPGRYQITAVEASNIAGTYPLPKSLMESILPEPKFPPLVATLDGAQFDGKPTELTAGFHHIECGAGVQVAVVWLGPHMDRIPRMGPADHRWLFVNWY
jgi:hypothetical protein